MNDRPPTDHVRAPTCQAVDFGWALKLLAQSVWKLWIIVHNLHTRARAMHANQVKSSGVYFTSSGVASKQEKWDCNPNWTLFAEICAEERGDLRDVFVESGASSFSRATILRDATVNPCGSNLLVKNRFGRRSLRVWFSQGIKEFYLQRLEATGIKYRAQWRSLFLLELLAISFSFLIHSLNYGLTQW